MTNRQRLLVAILLIGLTLLQAQTPVPSPKPSDTQNGLYKIDIIFPFDAHVYVDGKMLVGPDDKAILTPATIQYVPAGFHDIAVAKPGFSDVVKVLNVSGNVDNLKFPQTAGKSQLLTKDTGKICFAPPTPAPAPTAPAAPAPAAPDSGTVPPPPKPLGPVNQGPLVGKQRDLPGGEVELQYSFDEEPEAGDFKRMTGLTRASWAPGQIMIRNASAKPGLAGIVLRVPMEIHKLNVKGKIMQGDHVLWFANVSAPRDESDWKWRPQKGAVGVWRADGIFYVLNAKPTEPQGLPPGSPAPFDFDVTFAPNESGQTGGIWTINWKQYGKRFAPEATLALDTAEPGCFGIGTWGSDVSIVEIILIGKLPKP